jgi:hypothetical protein
MRLQPETNPFGGMPKKVTKQLVHQAKDCCKIDCLFQIITATGAAARQLPISGHAAVPHTSEFQISDAAC